MMSDRNFPEGTLYRHFYEFRAPDSSLSNFYYLILCMPRVKQCRKINAECCNLLIYYNERNGLLEIVATRVSNILFWILFSVTKSPIPFSHPFLLILFQDNERLENILLIDYTHRIGCHICYYCGFRVNTRGYPQFNYKGCVCAKNEFLFFGNQLENIMLLCSLWYLHFITLYLNHLQIFWLEFMYAEFSGFSNNFSRCLKFHSRTSMDHRWIVNY